MATDSEFRAAVLTGLAYPGKVFEADGLYFRVYPSHDRAVQIPDFFNGGSMYRVMVKVGDIERRFGADSQADLSALLDLIAVRYGRQACYVAMSDPGEVAQWINADGTPCKIQDGIQWRAIELKAHCGSVLI